MSHHRRYVAPKPCHPMVTQMVYQLHQEIHHEPIHAYKVGKQLVMSVQMYENLRLQHKTANKLVPAAGSPFAGMEIVCSHELPVYKPLSKSARRFRRKYKGAEPWDKAYIKFKTNIIVAAGDNRTARRGIVVPRGFNGLSGAG